MSNNGDVGDNMEKRIVVLETLNSELRSRISEMKADHKAEKEELENKLAAERAKLEARFKAEKAEFKIEKAMLEAKFKAEKAEFKIEKATLEAKFKAEKVELEARLKAEINDLKSKLNKETRDKDEALRKSKTWKEKFEAMRDPEVVRTEISTAEKHMIIRTGFFVDTTLTVGQGLSGDDENDEICRQKWVFIQQKSNHDRAHFIRQIVLFKGLSKDRTKFKYLAGISFPKVIRGKKIQGYECFLKYIQCVRTHLMKKWYEKDEFVKALFNYLDSVPWKSEFIDDDTGFKDWCLKRYADFAIRVKEVFSVISHEIHHAHFLPGEDIPPEYYLIKEPLADECVNIIMSEYQF